MREKRLTVDAATSNVLWRLSRDLVQHDFQEDHEAHSASVRSLAFALWRIQTSTRQGDFPLLDRLRSPRVLREPLSISLLSFGLVHINSSSKFHGKYDSLAIEKAGLGTGELTPSSFNDRVLRSYLFLIDHAAIRFIDIQPREFFCTTH